MKHKLFSVLIAAVSLIIVFFACDLAGSSSSDDSPDGGGIGADFDANLYYTKTDSDSLYYQKNAVDGFLTAVHAKAVRSIGSGDQSIPTGTAMEVALGSLSGSPMSSFELSGTGGIKCLQGGVYMIVGIVNFPDRAAGIRIVRLKVNGSATQAVGMLGPDTLGFGWTYISVTDVMELNAGDTVSMEFIQTSGSNLDLYNHTHLSVAKIGN